MSLGITKKRIVITMIAAIATAGAVFAAMNATNTTDMVGVGKKPRKAPTAIANPFVPNTRTPLAELAPNGVEHAAVLKIETDMRYDGYAIVIDSWTKGDALAEVRMWWLNPAKANERSPFGKGVTRYVDIGYDKLGDDGWRVRMRAGVWTCATHRRGAWRKPTLRVARSTGVHTPNCRGRAVLVGYLIGSPICISIGYASLVLGFSIEASELAAILGWGVLRGVLRRTSIVENTINQTIASAVDGASAGMMFSAPALSILEDRLSAPPTSRRWCWCCRASRGACSVWPSSSRCASR